MCRNERVGSYDTIEQKLGPEQRKPYEEMAKGRKENCPKKTSLGELIDKVKQEEDELKQKEVSVKKAIRAAVTAAVNTGSE